MVSLVMCRGRKLTVTPFLDLLKSLGLNLYDKNQVYLLLRSICIELVDHPNLYIPAVIKRHLICLEYILFVYADTLTCLA
jgi:hypothetical protein